jgi:ribosome-associated protein
LDTAHVIVDAIANKMGSDILLLDLSEVTVIADYFIIATGESARQMEAIAEDIQAQLKETQGLNPISVEGTAGSGWVLIDYGGIVVHVFSEAQRHRYQLEEFWSDARTVVRVA